eukprot:TRINITY_DN6958_c0_g1_i2.p1 TRINITY_DN6958_c0_g1~~TRINITY_DN6958_c0_g1_i2.p1  ORF type:complete len:333 (-),score=47.19 TRINITY_DN6958_c0_g1_i2:600-1577(-)
MTSMGFCSLVVLFAFFPKVVAWGADGHTIVAHLAEQYLNADVKAELLRDFQIPGDGRLSYASNWNDDYDHKPVGRWSSKLHFINYPGRSCNFFWTRDCADDACNPGAIVNYTSQVFDKSLHKDQRFFALKFLIHMMGDLHQPLHVSSPDDFGGNAIKLAGLTFTEDPRRWINHTVRLHSVWDGQIIVRAIYDLMDEQRRKKYQRFLLGSRNLKYKKHKKHKKFVRHYHKWQLLADELQELMDGAWAANKTQWEKEIVDPRNDINFRAGLSLIADESATLGCEYAYVDEKGRRIISGGICNNNNCNNNSNNMNSNNNNSNNNNAGS